MPRVSAAFYMFGILCVIAGMGWGMDMASTHNFTMMPAHAHLNLVGWATMALYGTFYALTKSTMSLRLAWLNFVVSALGIVVMIPGLAVLLAHGEDPHYETPVIVGSIITLIGALIFFVSVFRELTHRHPA